MEHADRHTFALGYFESWNLESLQGVLDAAEQTRSPVVIGFNGEFLSRRKDATERDVELYSALGAAAAAQARVPCAFIFNECANDAWVKRAISVGGFNIVMPADPATSREDYTARVAELTKLAHSRGIAVEAEIDELPSDGHVQGSASDPIAASRFVQATGVDLLAISVGNEHIKLEGRAPLDLARLKAIHDRVKVPLVLHGGSGIEDASLQAAIRLGVRKVNYGTYIKQRYLAKIRSALERSERNPHSVLGDGSDTDTMVIGRQVVRDAVLERIGLLGCCGKA
jgi:fructose/tagatose bisphosphate aldolase